MTVFPMRGAHAGDLLMALPAIGAALAWGPVTVSALAPRYYSPFRRLPISFRFASPPGHTLCPEHKRGSHSTEVWLDALPQKAQPVRLSLPLMGIESAAALLPRGDWILLSPWSDFAPKRWTPKAWCEVAAYGRQLGYRVAVMGPPQARELCNTIENASGCVNLVGRDTPDTWPALFTRAALVITTDSAPVHLADALGIPAIGLYGHTTVAEFGPYWNRELCVEAEGMAAIGVDVVQTVMLRWHATRGALEQAMTK